MILASAHAYDHSVDHYDQDIDRAKQDRPHALGLGPCPVGPMARAAQPKPARLQFERRFDRPAARPEVAALKQPHRSLVAKLASTFVKAHICAPPLPYEKAADNYEHGKNDKATIRVATHPRVAS